MFCLGLLKYCRHLGANSRPRGLFNITFFSSLGLASHRPRKILGRVSRSLSTHRHSNAAPRSLFRSWTHCPQWIIIGNTSSNLNNIGPGQRLDGTPFMISWCCWYRFEYPYCIAANGQCQIQTPTHCISMLCWCLP